MGFLALAALAFARPTRASATSRETYTQQGSLSYSAAAPAGAVYPGGRARTGQPLFVRLVDPMRVEFDYRLTSRLPAPVTGTAALEAELVSSSGWKRTLELQPGTSFNGDHAVLAGTLHLHAIGRLLRRVEAATGTIGSNSYTLTILPQIKVDGHLAGARLNDSFAPRVPFTLDPLELRPQLPETPTSGAASGGSTAADPFRPSTSGAVTTTHTVRQSVSFRGVTLPVARARRIAAVGVAASVAALLVLALLALRRRPRSEACRIQARYADILIPVARTDRRSYDEVVELASFDALVRVAERYERMILHEEGPLGHSYRVADDSVLYVYLVGEEATHNRAVEAHELRDQRQ